MTLKENLVSILKDRGIVAEETNTLTNDIISRLFPTDNINTVADIIQKNFKNVSIYDVELISILENKNTVKKITVRLKENKKVNTKGKEYN